MDQGTSEDAEKQTDEEPKPRVLIHCRKGVSRSVSIVIGYLISTQNMSFNEAYNLLKSKRANIDPNIGFVAQLKDLESSLKEGQ